MHIELNTIATHAKIEIVLDSRLIFSISAEIGLAVRLYKEALETLDKSKSYQTIIEVN